MRADVPILIVCRDRVASLIPMLIWLDRAGHRNVVLVDNDSSHVVMLDYLARSGHRAHFLRANLGPQGIWRAGVVEALGIDGSFVVTDPDVVPDERCPLDALGRFEAVLDRHPEVGAVGFGLRVDDVPAHYAGREAVLASEWVGGREVEPGVIAAGSHLPFALYRSGAQIGDPMFRLDAPYLARHATWYINSADPSAEERYTYERARREFITWGPFGQVDHAPAPDESRNRGSTEPVDASAWPIGQAPELVAGTPGHEAAIDEPTFSILMPTTGRRPSLARAVDGLLAQDYERWELVLKVVDADAARRQLPDDDRIVVLEGPDRNLTHAVNLAMEQATGDVFNWANDDDLLLPDALSYVAQHLREAMWLRAAVALVDGEGRRLGRTGDLPWDLAAHKAVPLVAQPGVFWRREAVASIGSYDEAVALASDYDYYTRLGERWEPRSVDRVVAEFRLGGDALSHTQQQVQNQQMDRIRARSPYGELAKRDAEIAALRAERDRLAKDRTSGQRWKNV